MEFVFMPVQGGLGDQLLDIIAAIVIAKLFGSDLHLIWKTNDSHYPIHGSLLYDRRLFDFDLVTLMKVYPSPAHFIQSHAGRKSMKRLIFKNASASSCPRKVHEFLVQQTIDPPSYPTLLQVYHEVAMLIRPSSIIEPYIMSRDGLVMTMRPSGDVVHLNPNEFMNDRVGLHLRATDKVVASKTDSVFTNFSQFASIREKTLSDLRPHASTIYICSENDEARRAFRAALGTHSKIEERSALPPEVQAYEGVDAVLDMFCLSRCKSVYQSVNYSTFSLLATLIGGGKLINYTLNDSLTLLHGWVLDLHELTAESLRPWAPMVVEDIEVGSQ